MARADGRKVATWVPPGIDPETGKPHKRRYYFRETQAEADAEKAADRAREAARSAPVPDGPTPSTEHDLHTLAGLLWFPRFELARPNTARRYRDAYRLHVRPRWGALNPGTIRPAQVQGWINDMVRQGVAPASITLYRGILSTILKLAVAEGIVPTNPASAVRMPKIPKRVRAVPPSRVRDLLAAVEGTELAAPVFLSAVLGLSRGELCGLRWDTIDRPTRRVSVVDQLLVRQGPKTGKTLEHSPTKRDSRVRSFVLPAALFETLERFVNQDGAYLCVRARSRRRWNPEHLTAAWAGERDRLGFADWHLHDLRHAAAGVLAFAEVDLLTIAAILGHASIDATMLYAAAQEAAATRGFGRVADALFPVDVRKPDVVS